MEHLHTGDRPPGADLLPINDIPTAETQHVRVEGGRAQLAGSRCRTCASPAFPKMQACAVCGGRDLVDEALGGEGNLYSFSTVHVSSSKPVPYTIGYVDMPVGVRVLANLRTDAEPLRPDQTVILAADDAGWFFSPAKE